MGLPQIAVLPEGHRQVIVGLRRTRGICDNTLQIEVASCGFP